MPGDKRRIQTAVLGGATSDVPLILPMEAIELDAFRQEHSADTFWCGLLLGGCGTQLSTKLYTDRVCHFAHLPDPTGVHACQRRARDVSSADHLYVKSAALAWLRDQEHHGDVHLCEPIGSVVDIAWEHGTRGLRLHLDGEVAPAWDNELVEPVLGTTVPVDVDTLVRRRYIHRVRLDSVGTARRVRIGTQAPARDTEWFTLGECHMSSDGFRTPAVEEILAAAERTAWSPFAGVVAKGTTAVQRLEAALGSKSMAILRSDCRTVEAGGPYEGDEAQEVAGLLERARLWLEEQEKLRADLFGQLAQAVRDGESEEVTSLLTQADRKAARERTLEQHDIARQAAAFLKDEKRRAARAARENRVTEPVARTRSRARVESVVKRAQSRRESQAHGRMLDLLDRLGREADQLPVREFRYRVFTLSKEAEEARALVTAEEARAVESWLARAEQPEGGAEAAVRAGSGGPTVPAARRPAPVLAETAASMRSVLTAIARSGSAISTLKYGRTLAEDLHRLHPEDQVQVLMAIEDSTRSKEPLLCSVLALADTASPHLYRDLASRLGRQVPAGTSEADEHWQAEVLRLQQHFHR